MGLGQMFEERKWQKKTKVGRPNEPELSTRTGEGREQHFELGFGVMEAERKIGRVWVGEKAKVGGKKEEGCVFFCG